MPSQLPLPTIEELRQAFHNSVRGSKESTADGHAGSVYDHFAGVGAILWSWQAQRDKDQFESIYFEYSSGQELTDYVLAKDEIERSEDTYGTGFIYLSRPSISLGTGKFWKGTRVNLFNNGTSVEYSVSSDTTASPNDLSIQVPIKANFTGPNSKIDLSGAQVKIVDPLWDNTWIISRIKCDEGTDFQQASEFRALVKDTRKQSRVGYEDIIKKTCNDLGASNIFLFRSDFGGENLDYGINVAYVGDDNFSTTDELRYKCIVGLESVRVLGADLLVRPLGIQPLQFDLNVNLWTDPNKFDTVGLKTSIINIILDYFKQFQFSYDLNSITGAIRRILVNTVQSVSFTLPVSSQGILDNGVAPAILNKYIVSANSINVNLLGPA